MALLIVLFVMALAAALMLATNDRVMSDLGAVSRITDRDRTIVAAEAEVWRTLAALDARVVRTAPVGRVLSQRTVVGDMVLTRTVEKTDTTNVWIVGTATVRTGAALARHRVGMSLVLPSDLADSVLVPIPHRAWTDLF